MSNITAYNLERLAGQRVRRVAYELGLLAAGASLSLTPDDLMLIFLSLKTGDRHAGLRRRWIGLANRVWSIRRQLEGGTTEEELIASSKVLDR